MRGKRDENENQGGEGRWFGGGRFERGKHGGGLLAGGSV